MHYSKRAKVRFADVDPAGIVFYPRYFELLNAAIEDWFEEALGLSFAEMHLRMDLGVPTVKLECDFSAPSFLGDEIDVDLDVLELGRSSCTLAFRMSDGDSERLSGRIVLVCMHLKQRNAVAWPENVRKRMLEPITTP